MSVEKRYKMEMRRVGGRVVAMRDGENMYSVPADDTAPLWRRTGATNRTAGERRGTGNGSAPTPAV